ncbi:MAG: hypothetical protein Q9179_003940, partial [Wetmoreana sp. 5 TL-2023]
RLGEQAQQIREEDEAWLADSENFNNWEGALALVIEQQVEGDEGEAETERGEITMEDLAKRREIFMRAVKQHKILLKRKEKRREDMEREKVWREKVERRRRAELVLCVLEEEERARGRKEGFGHSVESPSTDRIAAQMGKPAEGPKPKAKRKRKRRTTGIPDDDESSSSSSSSSSNNSDNDDAQTTKRIKIATAAATTNGTAKGPTNTAVIEISSGEESDGSESESDESEVSSSTSSSGDL